MNMREPAAAGAGRPLHHGPDGGFRNPWPPAPGEGARGASFVRWRLERFRNGVAPDPPPGSLPLVESEVARPRAAAGELRATWVGHSTFLLQIGGWNVLTDPIWSRRCSPVRWAGPARLVPPGLPFDRLPPVDAVVLSHDHYDHLDSPTVRRLRARFGDSVRWITPPGYRLWFARRGVENVTELDWWDEATLEGGAGRLRVTAVPARHWSRRRPVRPEPRLWAGFVLAASGGRRVYFAGDTGYFPGFAAIGRLGPFDACLLPVGAYEPRWFMRPMHMDPNEAVRAYLELGGQGLFLPMHWGTFRLSDEDPLEPPIRLRRAWKEAGLPTGRLRVLRHGETARIPAGAGA